jgi:4-hydroxythreonine-4-phosphate dehydrogenase
VILFNFVVKVENNQAMDARDRKIKVGISIGDPNGVGIEIILKIFQDKRMFDFFTPIVFASTKLLSAQRKHFNLHSALAPYDLNKKPSNNQINVVEVLKGAFETNFGQATIRRGSCSDSLSQSGDKSIKSWRD